MQQKGQKGPVLLPYIDQHIIFHPNQSHLSIMSSLIFRFPRLIKVTITGKYNYAPFTFYLLNNACILHHPHHSELHTKHNTCQLYLNFADYPKYCCTVACDLYPSYSIKPTLGNLGNYELNGQPIMCGLDIIWIKK